MIYHRATCASRELKYNNKCLKIRKIKVYETILELQLNVLDVLEENFLFGNRVIL